MEKLTLPLALLAPVNTDSAIHLFALSSDANLTKAVPLGRSVALNKDNIQDLNFRFKTKVVCTL